MAIIGRFTRSLQALVANADDASLGEDIFLGEAAFGKAALQCCFVQSSSKWGKLGEQHGGVLYFNMTIKQPDNTMIRWAEFKIILRNYKNGAQAPAVLPMCLEPKSISGQEILVNVKKRGIFRPKVNVAAGPASVTAEGGEREREESTAKRYYWTLKAYGGAEEGSARMTRATWEWQANKKASQASTRTLQGGAIVVSVVEGDFEIELGLRCQLKSRTEQAGQWVKRRLGFRKDDLKQMIKTVHSYTDGSLESAAAKLKDNVRSFNEFEQSNE